MRTKLQETTDWIKTIDNVLRDIEGEKEDIFKNQKEMKDIKRTQEKVTNIGNKEDQTHR